MPEAPARSTGAVILVSGGLESSTLPHHVARTLNRAPLHALSFQYGQRHDKELACAQWQASDAGVAKHKIIDLSFLGTLLEGGSALLDGGADVPDLDALDDSQRNQPPTYVPNRNMMLLSMAAAYAETQGFPDVFYGAQAQDEYGYWDCTTAFLERLNHTLALNRRQAVRIEAPFVAMKKSGIVQLGLELNVDYAHTWTCYRGGDKACGTCPTCVERLNAFQAIGVEDLIPYEN